MKTSEERLRVEKLYNHLYHRVDGKFDWTKCIYCNDNMQVWDHCPPLSICESLDVQQYKSKGNTFILYPCCNICNSSLNSYSETDIYLRFEYLIKNYTKKISKYVEWDIKEINKLGYSLRTFIKNKHSIYSMFRKKIDALKGKYYSNEYIVLINSTNNNTVILKQDVSQTIHTIQTNTVKRHKRVKVYTSFKFKQ